MSRMMGDETMGVAAQRRGDAVIARQAEYRYSEAQVALAKRQILRENQLLAKQVDEQAQELEALRPSVGLMDEISRRNEILTKTNAELEQRATRLGELYREQVDARELWRHSYAKLSEIVRLALTPEEYHRYREIVENG